MEWIRQESEYMENEFDIFTKEVLMPRLTELDRMLTDAGVKHELSLADEPMPGIWVRDMEDMDVFVTFILPVGEIGQTQDFLRIGAYADDGEFIRWSVPVTGSVSIGELTSLAQDFANGISQVVYPLADMAARSRAIPARMSGDSMFPARRRKLWSCPITTAL